MYYTECRTILHQEAIDPKGPIAPRGGRISISRGLPAPLWIRACSICPFVALSIISHEQLNKTESVVFLYCRFSVFWMIRISRLFSLKTKIKCVWLNCDHRGKCKCEHKTWLFVCLWWCFTSQSRFSSHVGTRSWVEQALSREICCFTSQIYSYGQGGTISYLTSLFPWQAWTRS